MSEPTDIWQNIIVDPVTPSLADLEQRERAGARRVRRRNTVEYLAIVYLILVMVYVGWLAPDALLRLACAALSVGAVLVGYNLRRRTSWSQSVMGEADLLAFYRAQLKLQHDALTNVARWYLAPFLPGSALLLLAVWRKTAETVPPIVAAVPILFACVVCGLISWFVLRQNAKAAKAIRCELDAVEG